MISETSFRLSSQYYDIRSGIFPVDSIIIHSMYNPDSNKPFSAQSCKERLDSFQVSAHYLIDRCGIVRRLVEEEYRAWHAGISRLPSNGRSGVNDFSIGIELIGSEISGYSLEQYAALVRLTLDIVSRYNIYNIYGHKHIAPDRKTDPWKFDWYLYLNTVFSHLKCAADLNHP